MSYKRPRPRTATSVRSTTVINPVQLPKGSRPGSAKQWFEAYNKRKNEEAVRFEDWKQTVDFYKKRQFQTSYYNHLSDFVKKRSDDEIDPEERVKKEKSLLSRREKLRRLLDKEEKIYEEERELCKNNTKNKFVSCKSVYPELQMLQGRLDELKNRNEEERRKMQEKLSYDKWKQNSTELHQMERERYDHFVRNAWVDQKQWKEDEKRKYEEQQKKDEETALYEEKKLIDKENKMYLERKQRLEDWKSELDKQVALLREKEATQEHLITQERELENEKRRIDDIIARRLKMQDLRKRKDLELCWARQYQLKLKKKAANTIEELLSDQAVIEDLIKGTSHHQEDKENSQKEAEWMKNVLEEQKRLENMREKEYDLLFSEEAERMWRKRQSDWEREQKARDKLMMDVIKGLNKQINDKVSKNEADKRQIETEKENCRQSIYQTRQTLTREQEEAIIESQESTRQKKMLPIKSLQESNTRSEARELARLKEEEERKLQDHRLEIARLEDQMRNLWGPKYAPPNYGRKKYAW